jgi:acetamidase/formamidase
VQGDGEVSQTAIECPMERVEVRLGITRGVVPDMAHAETPAGFITLGFGDTLNPAATSALAGMLLYLENTCDLERPQAMALASLVVDLRVTQVVNGVMGVHAVLPPAAFSVDGKPIP